MTERTTYSDITPRTGGFVRKRRRKMPVRQEKLRSGLTRVRTPGGVKAKGTTQEKADAQTRLLRGVEHGFSPDGKKGLASIKTAMAFGTKNPPPGKKRKRRILSSAERHMAEIEEMERDVGRKKRKSVKKKGK